MIKEYKIIYGHDGFDDMMIKVKEAIDSGWQPLGGLGGMNVPEDVNKGGYKMVKNNLVLYQSMIR